jgi:hypothetical protein
VHKRISPYLKTKSAVLVEDEFAGGSDAVPRLDLIRAGVPGPEVLEGDVRVLNAGWIYVGDDIADFSVRLHTAALGKSGKDDDQYEYAADQSSLHAYLLG